MCTAKKTLTVIFTNGPGLKQVQTFHLMAGNSAMARFIQYYTQSGPPNIIGSLWSGSFNLYSLMKQRSCQTVKPHLPSPLCPVFSFHQHHPVPPLFQKIPPGDWGRCLERPRDASYQRRPGGRECALILNINLGHFLMWGSITIPSVWMTSIHHSWRIH